MLDRIMNSRKPRRRLAPSEKYELFVSVLTDRRPQGWDLNLGLVRDDLDETAVTALEHQFTALSTRPAKPARPEAGGHADEVQQLHPVTSGTGSVDKLS